MKYVLIRQEDAMPFWNEIVEVLRESIFAYAQACNGNLGAGILAVTFLLRTALLPLGIHAARAAIRRQQATAGATPGNATPSRLERFTGIAPMPAFVALYAAVREASAAGGRFLWIGSLARPDWLLAIAATILTVAASAAGSRIPAPQRSMMLAISAAVTLVVLSKMAAGVGLYWAMSSVFGALQGWAAQREVRR
ncbi:MAG TPA: YidC/Oxa1 family membrane protein insertase [Vicinamibacterales bacterium]|nr:YidC/Oxa1 family membrane protein insertase [Vicinamibacterales bacterium]